jgi:integrase
MMRELIETGVLPLISNKKKTVTLQDFSLQDPSVVIEKIRCFRDWTVSKREDCVLLYKTFSEWLSKETFGYIPESQDLDRVVSQKRQISFETYIKILSHMDLREQILTKMFYLGGSRALEEVLSVKIEDIDFSRSLIHFSDDVSYPQHLFEDIKKHIQNRKKGYVFVGKDEDRVSTTTPFRALKKVALELGLDPDFTFKEFTKNI